MSRNQNFHAFDNDDGRRVLRLAARIRSLHKALRSSAAEVSCERVGGDYQITIDDPDTGVHRETVLGSDAFAVLVEEPKSQAALGPVESAEGLRAPEG